jgi:hypothetical protein
MKKEASVIRDMSSLPEKEQVQFWHEEFAPLLTQEHALRETLLVVGQRTSAESMHEDECETCGLLEAADVVLQQYRPAWLESPLRVYPGSSQFVTNILQSFVIGLTSKCNGSA